MGNKVCTTESLFLEDLKKSKNDATDYIYQWSIINRPELDRSGSIILHLVTFSIDDVYPSIEGCTYMCSPYILLSNGCYQKVYGNELPNYIRRAWKIGDRYYTSMLYALSGQKVLDFAKSLFPGFNVYLHPLEDALELRVEKF